MPRYGKCCCCFSARTGALILAILGVSIAGLGIISNSVSLGVFRPQLDDMLDQIKQASIYQFKQAEAELQVPHFSNFYPRACRACRTLLFLFLLLLLLLLLLLG
jgi:hypothetical protein